MSHCPASSHPARVRRIRRTLRAVVLVCALFAYTGCETLMAVTEMVAPTVIAVSNAVLNAAAANYTGAYATQVQALVSTFSQTSSNALQSFLEKRRQQRLLAAESPPGGAYPPDAYPPADPTYPTQQSAGYPAPGTGYPPPAPDAGYAPPPPPGTEVASVPPPAQAAAPAPTPIELDVALLKKSGPSAEHVAPMADGDALQRGDGKGGGDRFRLYLRPNVDSYVYVVAVDATGWVQPVFPAGFGPDLSPLLAEQTELLPGPDHWFGLDEHTGIYHLYFLASRTRRPDLEAQLQEFASQQRTLPRDTETRSVDEPVVVESDWVKERGGTLTARGTVSEIRTRSGTAYEVTPNTYSFGVEGADFVLTRWFRVE